MRVTESGDRQKPVTLRALFGWDALQRGNIVFVFDLFLVFDDLPVKLVDQQVDGCVHVGIFAFHKYVLAGQVDVCFDLLSQFFYAKNHAHIDHMIEMTVNSDHL